jgi:prepilin signal peptidase PulO-like enzyme (type II secretory pathway)
MHMELFAIVFFFGLGALASSFVTVIAERVSTGQSWLVGRSRCNSCAVTLRAHNLVPVLSWLVSLGRCTSCSARVPARYALIELVTGALFVLAYLTLGLGVELIAFLGALLSLLFVVLYDLRHTVVPTSGWVLLIFFAAVYAYSVSEGLHAFSATLMVAGIVGLAFWLLHVVFRGRAMGLGDAPVALGLALLVGSQAFAGLLFSFWSGAIIGIAILVLRRGGPTMGIEIPFVPFLAFGYLLAYFTQWNPLSLI